MISTATDAYNILNLPVGTCNEDILSHFKSLALKWHPDKNNRSQESYEKFNKLCYAFKKLFYPEQQLPSKLTEVEMFTIFEEAFLNRDNITDHSSESENSTVDDVDDDQHKLVDFLDDDISDCESEEKSEVQEPITLVEAEKNADLLVAEEEKIKKKVEKRRAKKKRQRQKKKKEKEAAQQKIEVQDSADSSKDSLCNTSLCNQEVDIASSEEELDPNCAFVANVAVKNKILTSSVSRKAENVIVKKNNVETSLNASNITASSKPESHFDNESLETCSNSSLTATSLHNVNQESVSEALIIQSRKHAIKANQYAGDGNFIDAIKHFTEAIKLNPHDTRFFGNRSFCYDKIQEYEKALEDAKMALLINKGSPKNYFRLGRALAGLNQLAGAENAFQTALKIDSMCKDAKEELGIVQIKRIMELGFTRLQAINGLQLHGSVEKAIESLLKNKDSSRPFLGSKNEFCFSNDEDITSRFKDKSYDEKMDTSNPEGYRSIWIGNVSKTITEAALEKMFSPFGHIVSLRILPDKHCAFINFRDIKSAGIAMELMQGYPCDGLKFLIRFPNTPPDNFSRKFLLHSW